MNDFCKFVIQDFQEARPISMFWSHRGHYPDCPVRLKLMANPISNSYGILGTFEIRMSMVRMAILLLL